jgi:hypothetical protein
MDHRRVSRVKLQRLAAAIESATQPAGESSSAAGAKTVGTKSE